MQQQDLLSRGIKNVIVVDKVQWRLDKAKELGAKIINTSEDNLEEKLLEYCGEVSNGAAFRQKILIQIYFNKLWNLLKNHIYH